MKRTITLIMLALVWTSGWARPATGGDGQDPGELFREGNDLYRQGNYEQALAAYQKIEAGNWMNGALYFNMGNCYYKMQDIGHAILYYERAARLLPGDEDVRVNLEMAKMQVRDEIVPLKEFFLFRWVRALLDALNPSLLRAMVFAIYFLSAAMIIVSWLARHPGIVSWGRRLAVVFIATGMVFGLMFWGKWAMSRDRVYAVILSDRVTVKSAPGTGEGVDLFTLHEGTRVRIDNRSGEWLEIVLADGKVGWIQNSALEII